MHILVPKWYIFLPSEKASPYWHCTFFLSVYDILRLNGIVSLKLKKKKNLAYMIFSIQICRLVLTFGNQCRLVQTVNRGKNLGKRCISAWNSVQQNLTECWGLESYLKPELFLTWHAVSKMQRSKAKYVCLNVCGCSDGALKEMDLKPKTLLLKTIKKEKDKLVTSHT